MDIPKDQVVKVEYNAAHIAEGMAVSGTSEIGKRVMLEDGNLLQNLSGYFVLTPDLILIHHSERWHDGAHDQSKVILATLFPPEVLPYLLEPSSTEPRAYVTDGKGILPPKTALTYYPRILEGNTYTGSLADKVREKVRKALP